MLTRGNLILSSTTPQEPNHEFNKYIESHQIKGGVFKLTLFEALDIARNEKTPRITPEIVNEIITEYPNGKEDEEFRREYLCEKIVDGDLSVVPEFTNEIEKEIVKDWPIPPFCDKYVSMDIGFKDLTVVLFGFYDWDNAVFVFQDEIVINGPKMTTDYLAKKIISKEKELWTNKITNELCLPYRRISDNNLIVINDLQRLHGINFLPTQKDNKEMQINNLRMMIRECQVAISPKCKTLVSHLKNATWDRQRKDFSRSPDLGHYDAVDAALYMVRNIDKNRNPYPPGYKYRGRNDIYQINQDKYDKNIEQFCKILKRIEN
jgi:hypothetical protein